MFASRMKTSRRVIEVLRNNAEKMDARDGAVANIVTATGAGICCNEYRDAAYNIPPTAMRSNSAVFAGRGSHVSEAN